MKAKRTLADELQWMPSWRLAEIVRSGDMSSEGICAAFLERIDQLDAALHSFITVASEYALRAAAVRDEALAHGDLIGTFQGVPYSAKDNIFTSGVRTTCGSRLLPFFVPSEDAGSIRQMAQSGGVLVGKANLPEFSSWVRSRNLVVEEAVNPWDLSRTAGGSSGGSAAAVAAGLVPLSIGTDDGGSIRLPAALCGVYGFLPSPGIVPLENTLILGSVSQAGPICRDVRDAAMFLDAMLAPPTAGLRESPPSGFVAELDNGVAGTRAAWVVHHEGTPVTDPNVIQIIHTAALRLADAGVVVEESDAILLDAMSADRVPATQGISPRTPTLRACDIPTIMRALEKEGWKELLAPYTDPQRLTGTTPALSLDERERRELRRQAVVDQMQDLLTTYDFILTPTIDQVAPEALSTWETNYGLPGMSDEESIASYVKYTLRVNLAGCPAASVPCGFAHGLPVALQIIGRPGADDTVLRASRVLEQLNPWATARPTGFA